MSASPEICHSPVNWERWNLGRKLTPKPDFQRGSLQPFAFHDLPFRFVPTCRSLGPKQVLPNNQLRFLICR